MFLQFVLTNRTYSFIIVHLQYTPITVTTLLVSSYICCSNSCSFFSSSVLNSESQYRHLIYAISLIGIVLLLLLFSWPWLCIFSIFLLLVEATSRKDMMLISCLYCSVKVLRVYSQPCFRGSK